MEFIKLQKYYESDGKEISQSICINLESIASMHRDKIRKKYSSVAIYEYYIELINGTTIKVDKENYNKVLFELAISAETED